MQTFRQLPNLSILHRESIRQLASPSRHLRPGMKFKVSYLMINRNTHDLEQCSDDLRTLVELLLGREADQVERVSGNGNNGVHKILSGKDMFALKFYRLDPGDDRDRLGTEIAALQFMQANAIKNVPTPIAHDLTANWTPVNSSPGGG